MSCHNNSRYDALWAEEEQNTTPRRDLFDPNDSSRQQMTPRRREQTYSTERPSRSTQRNDNSNSGMQMSRSTYTLLRRSPGQLSRPSTRQPAQPQRPHTLWNDSDSDREDSGPSRFTGIPAPPRRRRMSPSPPPVRTRRTRSPGPLDDEPEFFPEGATRSVPSCGRNARHETEVQHQHNCPYCFQTRGEAEMAAGEWTVCGEFTRVVFNEHGSGLWGVVFYDMW